MGQVKFKMAHAKGAHVNLGKKAVTISFEMVLDEESRQAAEDLAFYIGKGPLVVVVNPKQAAMEFSEIQLGESASQHEQEGE